MFRERPRDRPPLNLCEGGITSRFVDVEYERGRVCAINLAMSVGRRAVAARRSRRDWERRGTTRDDDDYGGAATSESTLERSRARRRAFAR